jgi:hypothetical protein
MSDPPVPKVSVSFTNTMTQCGYCHKNFLVNTMYSHWRTCEPRGEAEGDLTKLLERTKKRRVSCIWYHRRTWYHLSHRLLLSFTVCSKLQIGGQLSLRVRRRGRRILSGETLTRVMALSFRSLKLLQNPQPVTFQAWCPGLKGWL